MTVEHGHDFLHFRYVLVASVDAKHHRDEETVGCVPLADGHGSRLPCYRGIPVWTHRNPSHPK